MISVIKKLLFLTAALAILGGALSACIQEPKRLTQERVLDIVWEDLRPLTSTQNRGNWESTQISLVSGREVVGEFSALPYQQCPGPALPENQPIRAASRYWLVKVAPKDPSQITTASAPTMDENFVPEPLIQQAYYLVDAINGEIVARRLFCNRIK